ncbi:hypothetical protein [Bradyrhizobium sp. Leo121]|uniref:hypothetical protein n=1 Tax=Bradyrhizobium sp. Leo121 TaxID=1571195 RepID=UPI0032E521DA
MREARREIQRQLDSIDRQITRRMTALILQLKLKPAGRAPDPSAFLERYRSHLSAITAERRPEIDALSRKLVQQDAAIAAYCARSGLLSDRLDARGQCSRPGLAVRSRSRGHRDHE